MPKKSKSPVARSARLVPSRGSSLGNGQGDKPPSCLLTVHRRCGQSLLLRAGWAGEARRRRTAARQQGVRIAAHLFQAHPGTPDRKRPRCCTANRAFGHKRISQKLSSQGRTSPGLPVASRRCGRVFRPPGAGGGWAVAPLRGEQAERLTEPWLGLRWIRWSALGVSTAAHDVRSVWHKSILAPISQGITCTGQPPLLVPVN